MKKSLFSLLALTGLSLVGFAQNYSLTVAVSGATAPVSIHLNVNGSKSTVTSSASGSWSGTFSATTGNATAFIVDCRKDTVKKSVVIGSGATGSRGSINLNFCGSASGGGGSTNGACKASFTVGQVYRGPRTGTSPGKPVPYHFLITNTSAKHLTYLWDFGDGSSSSKAKPSHKYKGSGPYTLCLIVSSAATATSGACSDTSCYKLKMDSLGMHSRSDKALTIWVDEVDESQLTEEVASTTNIAENKLGKPVKVYPNPASDVLNIVIEGVENIEVKLLDIAGKMVMESDNPSLHLKDTPKGIYLLQVSTELGIHTQRIIVE